MKKICLIIIGLVYYISCFGQKVALSDTVSIKLPKGAQTLTLDGFSATVTEQFGYSKIALKSIPSEKARIGEKYFYKVADIVVKLTHGKRRLKNKDSYLFEIKKTLDNLSNLGGNVDKSTSVIKTVHSNTVLINYYEEENVGYYDFYCNDVTNSIGLNGRLLFKLSDKDKATTILNGMLDSVEFAKQ